jgi:diadenosine tetraphosphatase ApaH/serine/threonine PP2A family protein phosphatase
MSEKLIAVFADIHSNLEALTSVLADGDAQGLSRHVCLGDIVGYAANPSQCLEMIRGIGCPTVKGNHDEVVASEIEPDEMQGLARRGIEFARKKLSAEQRDYLANLPLTLSTKGCEFVHACLDHPDEWLYIVREPDAREHFRAQTRQIAFCGHTHVPMVWHLSNAGEMSTWGGHGRIQLPSRGKTLVNVGSVGQPRDLNPDACYVIFDPVERTVEFRRVKYDIAKARRKISRATLPKFLGQRLSLGR